MQQRTRTCIHHIPSTIFNEKASYSQEAAVSLQTSNIEMTEKMRFRSVRSPVEMQAMSLRSPLGKHVVPLQIFDLCLL